MLLPFSSKFGVQEVDRFSQSPSDFGLRHLNVSYMTNFLESRSACWKWRPLRRDFEQNLSIQETFPARFRIPMRSPKVFQVINNLSNARFRNSDAVEIMFLKCEDVLFGSSSCFRILAYFMKYVYKFIFESEQRDNFGGNLFLSDFGRAKRDA